MWGFCSGPLDETLQRCIYRRIYIFNAEEETLGTWLLRQSHHIEVQQQCRSRDQWISGSHVVVAAVMMSAVWLLRVEKRSQKVGRLSPRRIKVTT